MQMSDAFELVREFHLKMHAPFAQSPQLLDSDLTSSAAIADQTQTNAAAAGDMLLPRSAIAMEELAEWLDAHNRNDLVGAADAWADRAYEHTCSSARQSRRDYQQLPSLTRFIART